MKLILHVGHPKCGSTTIQSLLWNNRALLEEQGIHLLGADFLLPRQTASWDWPLWFLNGSDASLGQRLAERKPEFAKMGVETLVLSAENLSEPARTAQLEAAFATYQTSAIYYIRRQDELLLSSWRQWGMKRGISIHQHVLRRVAEGKPNYRETLAYLSARLGAGRVRTAFLDPRFLVGGSLGTDFWSALDLKGQPRHAPDKSNPSPDRAILLFLAQHPEFFTSEHDDGPVQLMLQADLAPPRRLGFDRHMQRSIKSIYDRENIPLVRDFMARDDGDSVIRLDSTIQHDPFQLDATDIARLKGLHPRIADPDIRSAITAL